MKVFVDEDTGSGLARALIATGVEDVDYVADDRTIRRNAKDVTWIPYVGDNGFLLLSRNTRMLHVPAERQLLVEKRVGVVFLPGHNVRAPEMVRLVLGRLDWLEQIDQTETRPFAFRLCRNGTVVTLGLHSA